MVQASNHLVDHLISYVVGMNIGHYSSWICLLPLRRLILFCLFVTDNTRATKDSISENVTVGTVIPRTTPSIPQWMLANGLVEVSHTCTKLYWWLNDALLALLSYLPLHCPMNLAHCLHFLHHDPIRCLWIITSMWYLHIYIAICDSNHFVDSWHAFATQPSSLLFFMNFDVRQRKITLYRN